MSRFSQALSYLLPSGFAWPREPGSVLMRVIQALADNLEEFGRFVDQTYNQWLPTKTQQRMAEWEAATSLPDPWATGGTLAQRRTRLLARLRGVQLPLADSSAGAPGVIEAQCAALGYDVTVTYNTPARCGRTRCGGRMGALNGVLVITMPGPGPAPDELDGFLGRIVPARFSWQYNFT